MGIPTTAPTIALIAPVAAKVLQALRKRKNPPFVTCVVVRGEGAYHALVSYEPGDPHDEWEIEFARKLSTRCEGPVHVASFKEDAERVTTCQRGKVVEDLEYDDAPHMESFVRELGLGGMFPPQYPGVRSFMFVESATVEAVEEAIGVWVRGAWQVLRLAPRGAHVLGWLENKTLGDFPQLASRELGTRVFHTLEDDQSFAVLVNENGATVGLFETPRTRFSNGATPVDSILGETTRDGILTAMGAPLDK